MSKILKLGFVLGGGVSLGSFSASALAESLKQLILFADYETGEKDASGRAIRKAYEAVEVDVFSGASAGAMSLAIMLRCLVNHRDKYTFLGFDNYMTLREAMEQQLLGQFGEVAYNIKTQQANKWESLVAVQTMQAVQAKMWTDEVSLDKLLGTGSSPKNMSEAASLVDRTVIDDLARKCFQFNKLGERLSYRSHVLASRVLLGCTISNLNFTANCNKTIDSSKNPFVTALNDASTDKVHSELRVFDFHFRPLTADEAKYCPLKWIQYHQADDLLIEQSDANGKAYGKYIRHIERNEVWREVAATAIASGAFPLAFEPVVLNRYQYEYGESWPSDLNHLTKYPFTYVDGGMFNNEPIREAFRLAAYLDNSVESSRQLFDRKIIFIDPNVTDIERQLSVNVHNKISVSRAIFSGKSTVGNKSSLLRIAAQVPHLLIAMLNEARKADAGHIHRVLERFAWRNEQRKFLQELMLVGYTVVSDKTIIAQRTAATAKLDEIRAQLALPNNSLQLQHEMLRCAREQALEIAARLPWGSEATLISSLNDFIYRPNPSASPQAVAWSFVLALVGLDISLGLIAKSSNMDLVPIAPFDFYKNDYSLMRLPGGGLAGFAGFTSDAASSYEVRYGQYCAWRILQEVGLISSNAPAFPLPPAFDYKHFDQNLKIKVQNSVLKRIKEMVPKGIAATMLPLVEGFLQDKVQSFVENNLVANAPRRAMEFRIRVGQELFSLRGFNFDGSTNKRFNLDALRADNFYYLICKLNYNTATLGFEGSNIGNGRLYVDKVGLFDNTNKLTIALPTVTPEMLRSPNPVFALDASVETAWGSLLDLPADRWLFYSEVAPLDEALWKDDNLRKLLDRMG
jgi:predicted acylesterase/phospholipase RssA